VEIVFSKGYNVKLQHFGIYSCGNNAGFGIILYLRIQITMRPYLFTILFFLLAINIGRAQQDSTPTPKDINLLAEFINADYEMGTIPMGKGTDFNVYIKNISTTDTLMIVDVKVGCGCTTPKYRSNDPILPGKSTYITLGFNGSAGGDFTKFADIIFKSGQSKQVKFHGVAVAEPLPAPPGKKQ